MGRKVTLRPVHPSDGVVAPEGIAPFGFRCHVAFVYVVVDLDEAVDTMGPVACADQTAVKSAAGIVCCP